MSFVKGDKLLLFQKSEMKIGDQEYTACSDEQGYEVSITIHDGSTLPWVDAGLFILASDREKVEKLLEPIKAARLIVTEVEKHTIKQIDALRNNR